MSEAQDNTPNGQAESGPGTLLHAARAVGEFRLFQEEFAACAQLAWADPDLAKDRTDPLELLGCRTEILVIWLLMERYPRLFKDWPEPASTWTMLAVQQAIMQPATADRTWKTFLGALEWHSRFRRPGETVHWVRSVKGVVGLAALLESERQRERQGGRVLTYRVSAGDDWAPAEQHATAVKAEVNRDRSAQHPGRRPEGRQRAYRQRVLLFNAYDAFRRKWPIPSVPWDDEVLRTQFVRAIRDRDESVNVDGVWPSVPTDTAINKLLTKAREWLAPDDPMPADKYLTYHLLARRLEHL